MNIAIVPIRNGSSRLQGKATDIKLFEDYNALECMCQRLKQSWAIDEVVFIMPENKLNAPIIQQLKDKKDFYFRWYCGSENDITGRAIGACRDLKHSPQDVIINITADCPLIDPKQIDYLVEQYYYNSNKILSPNGYIYVSNIITRSWPDGFDIQVYPLDLLYKIYPISLDKKLTTNLGWDIIHYSGYLADMDINVRLLNYPAPEQYFYPQWGLTLDYYEDSLLINKIFEAFNGFYFTAENVIDLIKENKHLLEINESCRRNIPGE